MAHLEKCYGAQFGKYWYTKQYQRLTILRKHTVLRFFFTIKNKQKQTKSNPTLLYVVYIAWKNKWINLVGLNIANIELLGNIMKCVNINGPKPLNHDNFRFPRWNVFKFTEKILECYTLRMVGAGLVNIFFNNNGFKHTVMWYDDSTWITASIKTLHGSQSPFSPCFVLTVSI